MTAGPQTQKCSGPQNRRWAPTRLIPSQSHHFGDLWKCRALSEGSRISFTRANTDVERWRCLTPQHHPSSRRRPSELPRDLRRTSKEVFVLGRFQKFVVGCSFHAFLPRTSVGAWLVLSLLSREPGRCSRSSQAIFGPKTQVSALAHRGSCELVLARQSRVFTAARTPRVHLHQLVGKCRVPADFGENQEGATFS